MMLATLRKPQCGQPGLASPGKAFKTRGLSNFLALLFLRRGGAERGECPCPALSSTNILPQAGRQGRQASIHEGFAAASSCVVLGFFLLPTCSWLLLACSWLLLCGEVEQKGGMPLPCPLSRCFSCCFPWIRAIKPVFKVELCLNETPPQQKPSKTQQNPRKHPGKNPIPGCPPLPTDRGWTAKPS